MNELLENILETRPGFHRASFPQVGGGYELTASLSLVQAVGDFDGIDFSFRAKYGTWEFQTENKEGHVFSEEHPNYYVRNGTYDQKKPNAMTIEWSLRILRNCFVEFWDRTTS